MTNGLLEQYRTIQPNPEAVYIAPDIHRMALNDPYPYALYREVLDAERRGELRIATMKILTPMLLWRRLLGERSIVHHHFFEIRDVSSFFNVVWKTLLLTLYRMAGGRIVWTIHNTYPHERTMMWLVRPMRKYIARVSTHLHVHCREAITIMSGVLGLPPEKFFVVPHPLYDAVIMEKSEARRQLEHTYPELRLPADRPLILMLGAVARYKGIDSVLNIIGELSSPPALIVAGAVKKGNESYADELRRTSAAQPYTRFTTTRITDKDMPLFYNAADYVLFNYTDILTSGGVAWAISYQKPIIIPRKGCLCELSGSNIVPFSDERGLRDILQSIIYSGRPGAEVLPSI